MENEIKGLPIQVGDKWKADGGATGVVRSEENGIAMVEYATPENKTAVLKVWSSSGSIAEEIPEDGDELLQLVTLIERGGQTVEQAEESALAETLAEVEQPQAEGEGAEQQAPAEDQPEAESPKPEPVKEFSVLRVDPDKVADILADRPGFTDTGKILLRNIEIPLSDEQRLNILEEIDRTSQKKEDAEEIFKAQQKRHKELVKSLEDEILRQLKIKREGAYTSERKCIVLQNPEKGVQIVVCVDTNTILESGPIALVQAEMFPKPEAGESPEPEDHAPEVETSEAPAEAVAEGAGETTPAPEVGDSPAPDPAKSAFDVGLEMGRAKNTGNPYPEGSKEATDWLKGWMEGHRSLTGAGKRKAPELDTDNVINEGILACEAKKDPIECPYAEGTPERERWLMGWSRHHDRSLKTQVKEDKIKTRRKKAVA